MAEVVNRVAGSLVSVGQTVAFRKERGKQGRGEPEREPQLRVRQAGIPAAGKGSAADHSKGHLVDIRA
jgi:hypothetical protein